MDAFHFASKAGKEFYLKADYLEYFTPDLIKFVNQNLDMDLMISIGYEYFQPEDANENTVDNEFPVPQFIKREGTERE